MSDSITKIADEIMRLVQHGATVDWRPNMTEIVTRLRALSPAGGDWVAKEGDRALGKNRGYALAAPPQQEPGATERAFTEEVGKDDKPTGYLLFESAPSGQTLAGAELTIAKYLDELATDPDPLDELDRRYIAEAAATIRRTATSAGTTGDDSEDAARLPSAQGWLDSHCSVASTDWMRGWDAAREALDAGRRAREVG